MLYIVYKDYSVSNFILEKLAKRTDIKLVQVSDLQLSLFMRVIYWFERTFSVNICPLARFSSENIFVFHKIKEDDKVLLWDFMQCVDVKYIIKTVKSSRIYLWIWNTIGESRKKEITYYKRKGITLCTFDKMDAQKYDIILLNQVFRDLPDKNFMGKYDFFFIGKDKGRYQFLEWIAGALVQKRYCVKFLLLADRDVDYPTKYLEVLHRSISYMETLELISQSRVIVDITKSNQVGITLRVLEAAFMGKKLLTNNKWVKELDFYNEKNMLIIDDTMCSLAQLDRFMQHEVSLYNQDVLSKYSIDKWIEYFL